MFQYIIIATTISLPIIIAFSAKAPALAFVTFFALYILYDRLNNKKKKEVFFTLVFILGTLMAQTMIQTKQYETTRYVDTASLGGLVEVDVEPFEEKVTANRYYLHFGFGFEEFIFCLAVILSVIFIFLIYKGKI